MLTPDPERPIFAPPPPSPPSQGWLWAIPIVYLATVAVVVTTISKSNQQAEQKRHQREFARWQAIGLHPIFDDRGEVTELYASPVDPSNDSRIGPTNEELAAVTELRSLKILSLEVAHQVTDEGILQVRKMDSLRELVLSGTSVTEDGYWKLKFALPVDCKIIYFPTGRPLR